MRADPDSDCFEGIDSQLWGRRAESYSQVRPDDILKCHGFQARIIHQNWPGQCGCGFRVSTNAALGCAVSPLAKLRTHYDFVLIDCPPRLSVVSYLALCASDYARVPMEAADYGVPRIAQVNAAIADVRRRHNPDHKLLSYLVSLSFGHRKPASL